MQPTMIERKVTYTVQHHGRFYVIEGVPARVCRETGEEFFAPETIAHLQAIINGKAPPARLLETPVFDYV